MSWQRALASIVGLVQAIQANTIEGKRHFHTDALLDSSENHPAAHDPPSFECGGEEAI